MTLTQLEHVFQAYKAGSFSRAARSCGIGQAALSNSVAKLEEELGERIFSRTTRHVILSPFGETLIPHVERMLAERDALVGAAKAQQAPTKTVIGHSPLIPSRVLTQIVGVIRDASFGSEIRLVEENLANLLQRLSEHTLDLALLPEAEYAKSIRSAPVCDDPLYYVPRRSIEASTEEVQLGSLGDDTFVMVPDQCGLARTTRALFTSAGVPLRVYAGEAMGYHVLQEWAALDLGSAILPLSRLSEGTRAVRLMRTSRDPAVLTYRVAWHNEFARGKQLAALLQPFRPSARAKSAASSKQPAAQRRASRDSDAPPSSLDDARAADGSFPRASGRLSPR